MTGIGKKKLTAQSRGTPCHHVIASVREGVDESVDGVYARAYGYYGGVCWFRDQR